MKLLRRLYYYLTEYAPYNAAGCKLDGHTYQYASCPFTGKTYGDCTSCGHSVVTETQAPIV